MKSGHVTALLVAIPILVFFLLRHDVLEKHEEYIAQQKQVRIEREARMAEQRARNEQRRLERELQRTMPVPIPPPPPVRATSATLHPVPTSAAPNSTPRNGEINISGETKEWKDSGTFAYVVPASCPNLHVLAWGGGGAGGSWSYGANGGGGAASAYSVVKDAAGKPLRIVVGGGGWVGQHGASAVAGRGGSPDGGEGGTGYDATGGGGGGASQVVMGETLLVVAGGGGGGSGHGDASGIGGSAYIVNDNGVSGITGKDGVGGAAGRFSPHQPSDMNLQWLNGTVGEAFRGGKGGSGGRKGGGGGGGGYGGGGGGAPDFHYPGGGGGGGSKGDRIFAAPTDDEGNRYGTSGKFHFSHPANARQAQESGKGGQPTRPGNDGKVVVWCTQ